MRMSKTTKTVPNINVLSRSEVLQPTRQPQECAVWLSILEEPAVLQDKTLDSEYSASAMGCSSLGGDGAVTKVFPLCMGWSCSRGPGVCVKVPRLAKKLAVGQRTLVHDLGTDDPFRQVRVMNS